MKKAAFVLIMFFLLSTAYALELSSSPYGAELNFKAPEDTVYIDIYIDNIFQVRLDGSATCYELTNLKSNTDYDLSIAYRRADNSDISAEFDSFKTTNWDGIYLWVNTTDEDNKGRVREIRLKVKTVDDETYGQYNEIYMKAKDGRELRLFPLFDLNTPVSWVDYKGTSDQAVIYRENAELFNKSSIDPSRWILKSMEVSPLKTVSYVDTRAFGLTIEAITSFTFFLDENGVKSMAFLVTGPSILSSFYFSCPDENSTDGSFILKNVE